MCDLVVRRKHNPAFCGALRQRIKAHTQRKLCRPLNQRHIVAELGRNRKLTGSRDQVPVLQRPLSQLHMVIRTLGQDSSNWSGIGSDCVCQDRQSQ